MQRILVSLIVLLFTSSLAIAKGQETLRIIDQDKEFTVKTADGPVKITRIMTPCAKNKGWLQPLIPAKGINPVTEIEVLNALNDKNFLVVDMRTVEWRVKATIPGSIHIPYTEIAKRLTELGCEKQQDGLNCDKAKKVLGFCNGPVCPQSPTAMKAMIREGFPANKIYYYRGGMLAWDALGFTTVQGDF